MLFLSILWHLDMEDSSRNLCAIHSFGLMNSYSIFYFLHIIHGILYLEQLHKHQLLDKNQSIRIQTQTHLEESPKYYLWRDWKLLSLTTPATNPNIQKLLCMSIWCNSFTNCTLDKSSFSFISHHNFSQNILRDTHCLLV